MNCVYFHLQCIKVILSENLPRNDSFIFIQHYTVFYRYMYLYFLQDYIDGFDKLLRLGLKSQQEREIIHIIVDLCLQEKKYNPFYMLLLQKFCLYHRRFQVNTLLKKLIKLTCFFRNSFGIKFILVSTVVMQLVEHRLLGKIWVMLALQNK